MTQRGKSLAFLIRSHYPYGMDRFGWQSLTEVPKDGTIFLFRPRNLTTWETMLPLVGRYNGDVLEWNNFGKWQESGFPLVMWAPIPELI